MAARSRPPSARTTSGRFSSIPRRANATALCSCATSPTPRWPTQARALPMLKARLIGVVPVKDGWAVQSFGFSRFLPVGHPEVCVEFLDRHGVDEIALLDISATREGRGPDIDMLARCARRAHVPIAFGGGVTTVEQM